RRLAAFDATTRQVPAGHIAVTHQEEAAGLIETGRAHPHRHAARKREIAVQHTHRELPEAASARRCGGDLVLFHGGTSPDAFGQIKSRRARGKEYPRLAFPLRILCTKE